MKAVLIKILAIVLLSAAVIGLDYIHIEQSAHTNPYSDGYIKDTNISAVGQEKPLPNNNLNPESLVDLNSSVKGVPVLMYHHIGDYPARADKVRRDLTVSVKDFTEQIQYLKDAGFHTITTTELYDYVLGKFILPPKPVIITLDDGYKDAFENAVPILVNAGMRGVFAVITQYPVGYPDYANWDLIKASFDQGMEIIPHTQNHIDLKNKKYSYDAKKQELQGSVKDIQEHLNFTPTTLVFPYGNYDQISLDILKEIGIKIAFTTKGGLFSKDTDLLTEPRVRVHGQETIERFASSLGKPELSLLNKLADKKPAQ